MFPGRMSLSPAGPPSGPPEESQESAFIERPIRRSSKTAEEIDQSTVDEDSNDVERAVYSLSVGQEVQRASVISNSPTLVRQNPAETFRRVVPKVREVLNGAGAEIQSAAATSFLTISQDDIISIHTHTYSISKTVLLHLNHRDAVVSSAWLETSSSAINASPKETIKQEVSNPLLYHSQSSHSLQARSAACRILGKASCKFDSLIVKKESSPLARSLCRDMESEVRVCMCRQSESVARAIGVEDSRNELLPELSELAGDEDSSVRSAAFDSIISSIEMMDGDDRLHSLVPSVMSACDASTQVDEGIMVSSSFQFGKLCSGLAGSSSDEQKRLLSQKYQVSCITGSPADENQMDVSESTSIRCNCCYNSPAMVTFVDPAHFSSDLYPSLSGLCSDPEVSVRRSAAASFHQVVKSLGSNVHVVHKELLSSLQDNALEVSDASMNHLDEVSESFSSRGENSDNKLPELSSASSSAEQTVGSSSRWRLHEKSSHRYSCSSRSSPGESSHQTFSARIFGILTTNKVLPVQKEAARTFCTFLRYNRKQEQRQEMMERSIQDLAQGRSYWNRSRFSDVCEIATEIFSRKYFNKHFSIPASESVQDPVANVRYKLCQSSPRLRASLRSPADKSSSQKLDFCVQKFLCREKDKDVVAMIRKTVLESDKSDSSEPFHKRHEWDSSDQKKEKEEMSSSEMEQSERQQNDGKSNKHMERKRRDSKASSSSTKSMSVSSSTGSSSSGKEMRKAKSSRSRSLSSQPTSSKPVSSDRTMKAKDLSSSSGKSTRDDTARTTHFTSRTQSTSSVPVSIRSKTTSLSDQASMSEDRDHRTSTSDHRTTNRDHRNNMMEHRTGSLEEREPRTSTSEHRDHRTSTLGQHSKTMERGGVTKDSHSKKSSINRKSSSFQSERE